MKGLCILGATGSIGFSTLDVAARHPDCYRIVALTAHRAVDTLFEQCLKYRPRYAVMADENAAMALRSRLAETDCGDIEVLAGNAGLTFVATSPEVDTVMAAIVGGAGLLPTLAAAQAGKTILLANKEALVMSGALFMRAIAATGACLLPIDSEHNAIFQCMPAGYTPGHSAPSVRRILLTASGGPFREWPVDRLSSVTPAQAVAHPNWTMGRKISVDSATMMNKGLELIEACWLFNVPSRQVEVVIHPQSVIHSLVDYYDGSVLAQMGNPDMRIPIAHAMAWPERFESGAEPLNLFDVKRLDFEPPDLQRFPCLRLAYHAIDRGGSMPTVLNAANEIAVAAFLDEAVRFTDIPRIIEATMAEFSGEDAATLEQVLDIDRAARDCATRWVLQLQ